MKVVSSGIFLLSCILSVLAYTLESASVRVGDRSVEIGEFNTQEIKQLSLESPKDKIEVEFQLADIKEKPTQVVLTLGDNKGVDLSLVPIFSASSQKFKLSLPASKIPLALKIKDKLWLNLIVADSNSAETNIFEQLTEIVPSADIKSIINYTPPAKIGLKPEIIHQFKQDASTVSAVVPVAFIGVASVLFLALLGSWASFVGSDLFGLLRQSTGANSIYSIGFLASLVGLELTFAKYYLGSTIFETLGRSFVLGLAGVFFGSRVLRNFAVQRKAGKV